MNNRFILILAACVIGFLGILFFTKKDSNKSNGGTNNQNSSVQSNHVTGNTQSKVTLVEFGDFECPACYKFFPILEQVRAKYKDKIAFQFRHLPLVEIHKNALIGARAAEAAGMQGKFFEMHDSLYTNQQSWSQASDPTSYFVQYAKELGLDEQKFKADLVSEQVNKIIQADRTYAKDQGFNSTPTFLINGKKLEDAQNSIDYFSQQIDQALAQQNTNGQ